MNTPKDPIEDRSVALAAAAIFILSWYFLYVDGLWGYTQYLAIKKKLIPASVLSLTVFLLIIKHRAPQNLRTTNHITFIIYAWLCWMMVVILTGSQISFSSPIRIAFGFYVNYWHFFLAALTVNSAFKIKEEHFTKLFFITAIPIVLLGAAQGIFQDNFAIGRWISEEAAAFNLGFYGKRRANGAFAHSEDLGCYCAMVASISLAYILSGKKQAIRMILIVVFLVAVGTVYFTLTRAAYLMAACSLIATVIIHRAGQSGRAGNTTWLPLAFFSIGLTIYMAAPIVSALSSTDTVLSSASLAERLYGNKYYLTELQRNGWHTILTGLGWYIGSHYRATFAIDNQYIALLLSTGIVGLILWCTLTASIWKTLLERAISSRSPPIIALTAICSTWLTQSIFNVTSTFAFAALLGLTIAHRKYHAIKA